MTEIPNRNLNNYKFKMPIYLQFKKQKEWKCKLKSGYQWGIECINVCITESQEEKGRKDIWKKCWL